MLVFRYFREIDPAPSGSALLGKRWQRTPRCRQRVRGAAARSRHVRVDKKVTAKRLAQTTRYRCIIYRQTVQVIAW